MKYMLLIHQGTTPLPGTPEWEALPDEEKGKVYADYQARQRDARHDPRRPDGVARDGDHRPRAGRQDADHRRPVRRHQGGHRRLLLLRGRRPRRRDRAGREDPGRQHGRRDRGAPARRVEAILDQAFREQWGRVLAALIGFLGDFDLAEEATQEAFAIAAERWPRDGAPSNPGTWLVTTARNRAIDRIRRDRTLAEKTRLLEVPEAVEDDHGRDDDLPRRAPRARLHLLPSGARHRGAGGADPAHARRPDDARDRPRLPGRRADDGPAAGARQAQDQGRRDPVPRAARPPAARSARRRAGRRLPDLQRGLRAGATTWRPRRCGSGARWPS